MSGLERVITAPSERRPAILDAIGSAKSAIRLSMFRCTDFGVMDKLAEARQRGVSVELLLTRRAKGWEKKIREIGNYLESMGAKVSRYALPSIKYHAKYLVVDDTLALVSSANLTLRYFEKTSDFFLETRDPGVVSSLIRLFQLDAAEPGTPLPPEWNSRLIVGPDRSRSDLSRLIAGARKSLRIVDHRVKDPAMVALLRQREQAGVAVEIFGKRSIPGLKSHGKLMIVDGRLAVLGSTSLSPPALGGRRELSIVVNDPDCVTALERFLATAGPGISPGALKGGSAGCPPGFNGDGDDDDDEAEEDDDE